MMTQQQSKVFLSSLTVIYLSKMKDINKMSLTCLFDKRQAKYTIGIFIQTHKSTSN